MKKVLKFLYGLWMKFAHALGRINSFILLTVFYVVVFGIARMVIFVLRKDLLDERWKDRSSYWNKREKIAATEEAFLKPY